MLSKCCSPRLLFWLASILILAGLVWYTNRPRVWYRSAPLANAIQVVDIKDGIVMLVDGRAFQPAGTQPIVSAGLYDEALRIATAQGVVVEEEFGEGLARLTVEPRFYNWCGTGRLGGRYLVLGLSELLVARGFADPVVPPACVNQDLSATLIAIQSIFRSNETGQVSPELIAFPMGANEQLLSNRQLLQSLIDAHEGGP